MKALAFVLILAASLLGLRAAAQQREIIVQAADALPSKSTLTPTLTAPAQMPTQVEAAIKILKEMQAQDAETLKKQDALMQTLEEIERESNQIRAYVHRS